MVYNDIYHSTASASCISIHEYARIKIHIFLYIYFLILHFLIIAKMNFSRVKLAFLRLYRIIIVGKKNYQKRLDVCGAIWYYYDGAEKGDLKKVEVLIHV